jgi:hypothetical protein
MSCKPILRDVPQQTQSDTSEPTRHLLPNGEHGFRPGQRRHRALEAWRAA